MEYISQSQINTDGEYTMTWKDQDGNKVVTEHNLFDDYKTG